MVFVSSVRSICLSVFLSVHPSFLPSSDLLTSAVTKFYFEVFLIMYISAATYQKLFIFGMGVPGRVLFHSTSMDPWVMPRGGARGQNLGCLNKVVYSDNQVLPRSFLIMYISAATYQKLFIFNMRVHGGVSSVLHLWIPGSCCRAGLEI